MDDQPEEMRAFFTARIKEYESHMLQGVPGCREGYRRMAGLLPPDVKQLLDLGCGTGLELEPIFERFPEVWVTGIDMTPAMLDALRTKYSDKWLTLIPGDYRHTALDAGAFDAAVSFETMHHLPPADKRALYSRIRRALRPGGVYIEGDYMVTDPDEEAFYQKEAARLREANGLAPDAAIHYDTPLTIDHQILLLLEAGFARVEMVWREENTTILTALA